MYKTDVIIMGYSIDIYFTLHEPSYVEWEIGASRWASEDKKATFRAEADLLNVLLRTHYSEFIESRCREADFYRSYAESQGASDWQDAAVYAGLSFKSLLSDDDEDSPF